MPLTLGKLAYKPPPRKLNPQRSAYFRRKSNAEGFAKSLRTEQHETTKDAKMVLSAKALVASAKGVDLEFQDVILEAPRPDEAVIEIHATGVCHGDLACMTGKIPVPFPIVLGHEGSGIVKQVGSAVEGLQPGDAVVASFNSCGDCDTCKRDLPAYCKHMAALNFGGSRPDKSTPMSTSDHKTLHSNFFGQSSFSSLAIVNARCLVKVANDAPLGLYAPLGCAMLTGAGALLNTLEMPREVSVAVIGAGGVGMAAIMAAKIQAAHPIIAIDLNDGRLELAKDLGASHTLKGSDPDLVEKIREICGGDGVRYAVDCTGVPPMIEKMIEALASTGKAATVGAPTPGSKISVDAFKHMQSGKHYVGSNLGSSVAQKMVPFLIEQHAQGNFPVEKIIKSYKVDDWKLALQDMESGKTIKPVLMWR